MLPLWWMLRRPTLHGAYVALWCQGRLLLIRNSYKRGETLPCGGLHRGESHRAAARRELAEEVGIEVPEDALRFAEEILFQGRYASDRAQFFELEFETEPEIQIDHREVVWAGFCPSEELEQRPLVGSVRIYVEHYLAGTSGTTR